METGMAKSWKAKSWESDVAQNFHRDPLDHGPHVLRFNNRAASGQAPDRDDHLRSHGCGDLANRMVHSAGVEPTTSAFGGQRSIQLSYECLLLFQTTIEPQVGR